MASEPYAAVSWSCFSAVGSVLRSRTMMALPASGKDLQAEMRDPSEKAFEARLEALESATWTRNESAVEKLQPRASSTPSRAPRDASHSVPVSRRNSFSRNVSATIDQFRSALNEAKEVEASGSPASSPRKSASFPQLILSNPPSPARQSGLEQLQIPFSHRDASAANRDVGDKAPLDAKHLSLANFDDVQGDDGIARVDSPVYSDSGSSSSSAYSPVAKECKDDEIAAQLQEQLPLQKARNPSFLEDLPDWLQERTPGAMAMTPTMDFSRSVQQIEDDIHHALDSAANRVTHDNERRERFQQQLQEAASYPRDPVSHCNTRPGDDALPFQWAIDYGDVLVASEPPMQTMPPPAPAALRLQILDPPAMELLLLVEVVTGEGCSETIEVHVGDEPHVLAVQFANKHALKPDAIPKLTQLIQDQLDELKQGDAAFADEAKAAPAIPEQQQQQLSQREPSVAPAPTYTPSFHHDGGRLTPSFTDTSPLQSLSSAHQEAAAPDHVTSITDSAFTGAGIWEKQEREYSRAMNYHNLIAKYGHYSQHSGKVNPQQSVDARSSSSKRNGLGDATRDAAQPRDLLAFRNIQLAEHARAAVPKRTHHTTIPTPSRRHTLHSSTNKHRKGKAAAPAVFGRLYALAGSKDKWIKRAQTAKQRELEREQDQRKVEMAAKSRELIAHRQHGGNGGYAHIGERLYEEALSDMAKKDKLREQRAVKREHQIDWMCPKCAFVNQFHDDVCKNIVSAPATSGEDSRPISRTRRESVGGGMTVLLTETSPDVICGQQKPEQLFRPTLMATPSTVAKAIALNKERATSIASTRREKNQQAIEQEFRQTCPFKPKINEVSEEIVRERLENEARVAMATTTTGELCRKDPHLALYEESFHVRANCQAREEEYMRQYSLKPDIGVNSLWISGDRSKDDLVECLAVFKYHEMEQKRLALHEKYAPDRDLHSGRAFFKPETGRAPIFNRNEKGLPIGEFLHGYHRRLLQQSIQEIHERSHQGFVSESSRQALAKCKHKTFGRIFDALLRAPTDPLVRAGEGCQLPVGSCPQEPSTEEPPAAATVPSAPEIGTTEELVVPSDVDIQKLPREIAHVVPIIPEFANHEPFDREQFAGSMEKLMTEVPGLTYTQVLFLAENLNDGKSSRSSRADDKHQQRDQENDEEQPTSHPTIDKNSSVIAKKHGRADRSKVFHALSQYFEHYKSRKEQIKKQQQREFERLHPFQPTSVSKRRKQQANEFYGKIKRTGEKHEEQLEGADRLSTAIVNVRPCVRPIDSDGVGHRIVTTKEVPLSRCSTPQSANEQSQQPGSDEDADPTSRVLAALDELPAAAPGSLSSSSQSLSSCASTASGQEDIRNTKLLLSPQDSERLAQLRSPEHAA